jgi:hypothetical protein
LESFWCGFCPYVKKLRQKRNDAWDERFIHIDRHYEEGRKIETWLRCKIIPLGPHDKASAYHRQVLHPNT